MTDIEQVPDGPDVITFHCVYGAVRPRHTLVGPMEKTARWTLRTAFGGHVAHPHFTHRSTLGGAAVSLLDSLYYDN